jgi:hypothetical protein
MAPLGNSNCPLVKLACAPLGQSDQILMCTTSIEFSERLFAEIAQTLVKSSRLMNFGGACETLLIQVQRDSVSVGCWCCYLNSFSFRHGRWPFQSVSQSVRAGHACEQPRTLPPLDPTDREADPPARDAGRSSSSWSVTVS